MLGKTHAHAVLHRLSYYPHCKGIMSAVILHADPAQGVMIIFVETIHLDMHGPMTANQPLQVSG